MEMRNNPSKWYYWGRWVSVMLFTSQWIDFKKTTTFKEMGLGSLSGSMKLLNSYYYLFKEDVEYVNKIIIEKFERDRSWFDRLFLLFDQQTVEMNELENKTDLKQFILTLKDYLGGAVLIAFIDICLENYLNKMCAQKKIPLFLINAHINIPRNTPLMDYKDRLRKLDKSRLNDYVKEFAWVGTHGFQGTNLTKAKVLAELESLSPIQTEVVLEIPAGFEDIVRITSELAYHRANIIETADKISFGYWTQLKNLGKQHDLSFIEIVSLTSDELVNLIDNGTIPIHLSQRKKYFGLIQINGKKEVLLGAKLKMELDIHDTTLKVNLLEGVTAYPGKVQGKITTMRDVNDFGKIKEGDILVAPETTPDYLVVMNKASAIVTDNGGLTCHAAIVAREMKKPCVIGTKVATQVFKDGDMVEVDADNGVVRKIE